MSVIRALASVDLHFQDGVVLARQRARDVAALLGFDTGAQTRIATAVSELARNAHRYAGGGVVNFSVDESSLLIEVSDAGPGIADLEAVLSGRYRSTTGMGQGLVGVRRLMDSFDVETSGAGTRVRTSKRLLQPGAVAGDSVQLRAELARGSLRSAYDEVQTQNQELLQALNELRSRQEELLHLNLELEDTNRGVVALYAELDERADQLRDADNRKSRFLADMSHELRTPLNSIVALTELLSAGSDPLTSEQRTQVEFIRRMATDQLQLVGELLDLAKIEAGRAEIALSAVSVPELFALLRTQLRPLVAGSKVSLLFVSEPGLPQLVTDERKLMHILRNLVGNAVKFTAQGEVLVSASAVGDELELSVTDTGVGIAGPDLARIFDEFVQIEGEHQRKVQGTGLGLPLARKLAVLLGGTLEATSTPGVGSKFVVTLPWRWAEPGVVQPTVRSTALVAAPESVGGETRRIELVLVADDDEAARYVVRQQLEGLVGEVIEAGDGEQALGLLSSRHPAAVILDLSMPDVGGLDVLARMRAMPEHEQTAVVIHTSKALDAVERSEIELHGAAIVAKGEASATRLLTAILERRWPR
ncbi:MAG TPA: ATP-binding protein [Solirubrobacteraceae bacterium]|jgi:signal transduction histidine kinase|nr:ATP-binding protein [Solirubrobacteraceae bacterium]